MYTEADECESNPCNNGGTCVDDLAFYTCICAAGYEGDQCDTGEMMGNYMHFVAKRSKTTTANSLLPFIDIDDCLGTPCEYGGACTDLVDDFSCDCTAGWMGNTCSQSKPINGILKTVSHLQSCICIYVLRPFIF